MMAPNDPAVVNNRERQLGEILKPPHLDKFEGDLTKIQKFFYDLKTHFEYYFPNTFALNKYME
jgi:hypothetical protein